MTTMMTLEREYTLSSAHFLPHVDPGHKCGRAHGHNFTVRLVCTGVLHPQLGWIFDFAELDRAWAEHVGHLDHRMLNEIEGLENPTSENLAMWIFEAMRLPVRALAYDALLVKVVVSERGNGAVTYDPYN